MEAVTNKLSIHWTDQELLMIIMNHRCICCKFGLSEMNRFFLLHEFVTELEVVKIWDSLIHALYRRVALFQLSLHNLYLWSLFQSVEGHD